MTESKSSLLARRKSLLLRLHWWAALIASPFALLAALTGILYIFTPQIERSLHGQLDTVQVSGARHSLDEIVAYAQAHAPMGMQLRAVQPPYAAHDSVRLQFTATQHGQHAQHHQTSATTLYVNPYTLTLLGQLPDEQRFKEWSANLHANLLQGENWRWMIELAASWLLLMLLSGIYLWWPRSGSGLPQAQAKGRAAWKQWHAFLGVALSVISIVIILTGLTWSKFAGEQVRALVDISGQAGPRMPKLQSTPAANKLGWQAMWDITRQHSPDVAIQLQAPRGELGVFRASAIDRSQPGKRFDLALDAYSGQKLYYSPWAEQSTFGQATAIGIPFHRGEFGWWNQALLLLFGLGVLFSLISGWVMFFQRRRANGKKLQLMPRLLPGSWRALPWPLYVCGLLLCALLPLLALSASLLLMLEIGLARRQTR